MGQGPTFVGTTPRSGDPVRQRTVAIERVQMDRRLGMLMVDAGSTCLVPSFAFAVEPGSDEVRSVVAEMLADAESRSSLLSAGDAGHDGGFFLAGDGFRMNIGGNMQIRYVANFRDDNSTQDDFESGFQNRRTQIWFAGNINKDWFYKVQGGFNREGGSFTLEDAFAGYTFANGWSWSAGQAWAPFLRESLVDEWKQLAADSSVVEAFFGAGRSQGTWVSKTAEDWGASIGFFDGSRTANTDFTSATEADYSFMGRFQYKVAGTWAQFDDFTSPRGSAYGCMIGAAANWQQSRNTNSPADIDTDVLGYTLDVSVEGDGWNVFGAFIGNHTSRTALGPDPSDTDDFGAVIQGGFMISDKTELFARWEGLFLDDDRGLSEENYNFVTAGLNHYFAGHAAKFTLDGIYAFEKTTDLISLGSLPDTGLGILGDTDDGEIVLRAQFQILF